MTEQQLATRLRSLVSNAQGDDLERATSAFGRMTEQQLDQQYGQSGRTCREIWDGYKQRRSEDKELAQFVEQLLRGR